MGTCLLCHFSETLLDSSLESRCQGQVETGSSSLQGPQPVCSHRGQRQVQSPPIFVPQTRALLYPVLTEAALSDILRAQEGPLPTDWPSKGVIISQIDSNSVIITELTCLLNVHFAIPVTSPSEGANDFWSSSPISGCLQQFHHQWEQLTSDVWVCRTITQGLFIEFTSCPPSHFLCCPVLRLLKKWLLMTEEICHLLDIRAIEWVPLEQQGTGFYLVLILVPKSLGDWRGTLNLKQLNLVACYHRFKMHSL